MAQQLKDKSIKQLPPVLEMIGWSYRIREQIKIQAGLLLVFWLNELMKIHELGTVKILSTI